MTPHYPRTVVLAALAIAACSQTEPPQASKPKPAATATAPQAPAAQPSQDIDPALRAPGPIRTHACTAPLELAQVPAG